MISYCCRIIFIYDFCHVFVLCLEIQVPNTKNYQNLEYVYTIRRYYDLNSIYQVFNLIILNNLFFN